MFFQNLIKRLHFDMFNRGKTRALEQQIQACQLALVEYEKQQQSLYRVISKIRASLDLDIIFKTATKETCKLLQADRIAVYRFKPDWGGEFVHNFEFVQPSWDEAWDQKTVWDDTYLQEHQGGRYARNETFVVDDVDQCQLAQCHVDILMQYHIKAFATAPIFVGQQLWGVLGAYQHLGPRHWTNQDVQFLAQVATQLGFAVNQSHLLTQAQQRAAEIQALNDQQEILLNLIAEIRQSLDINELFRITVKEVRKVLNTDRVAIFRFDSDSNYCLGEFVAENVLPEFDSAMRVRIQDRCFGADYALEYHKGRMQVLRDIYNANLSPCHLTILKQFQVKAQIIMPLIQGGSLWGLLCIHQCRTVRDWTDSEVKFLRQLADHFTVALEQASMLTRLQAQTSQLAETVTSLAIANEQLERLNNLDALTQVANRRQFDTRIVHEWARLRRTQQPLALIMIDVDYFKFFNDGFGHQEGDRCLQQVAQAVAKVIQRPGDLLCRYGGEEFALILPNTNSQGAEHVAQRIQEAVTNLGIVVPESSPAPTDLVTVSLGIAVQVPNDDVTINRFIAQADQALYAAKKNGRNTWVVHTSENQPV